MKTAYFSTLAIFTLLSISCQKSFTGPDISNGTDSTINPGNGNQLYKSVTFWSNPTQPNYDSTITLYTYDTANFLTKSVSTFADIRYYPRDAKERIEGSEQASGNGDTAFYIIQYADSVSGKILYTLSGKKHSLLAPDSSAYTYKGNYVASISIYQAVTGGMLLQQFQNFSVDGNGNVIEIKVFNADSTLNIGYSFTYDNNPNPLYAKDDARLSTEWGYTLSPNNITRQTNHYPTMPDDYVAYTYQYASNGKILFCQRQGTAIGQTTAQCYFYYK